MLGVRKIKKFNIIDGKSNAQNIVHISTNKFLQTEMDDDTLMEKLH